MAISLALAACASHPSSTTVTAAEMPKAAPSASKDSGKSVAEPAPEGQLVCRSQSRDEGTTELYLQWSGDSAKGTLRRISLSGMVSDTHVQAQRMKNSIIADDINASDLVVHAATVGKHDGKQYIRLGESKQNWTVCQ
jgi:hypothetical protein